MYDETWSYPCASGEILKFSNGVHGVLRRHLDHEIRCLIRNDCRKNGVQPEFIEVHLRYYCLLIIEFGLEKVQFICSVAALNNTNWSYKERLERGDLSVLADSALVNYVYYKGDLYSFYSPWAPVVNPQVEIFIAAVKNNVSPTIASLLYSPQNGEDVAEG
jgi:hypothetical protein